MTATDVAPRNVAACRSWERSGFLRTLQNMAWQISRPRSTACGKRISARPNRFSNHFSRATLREGEYEESRRALDQNQRIAARDSVIDFSATAAKLVSISAMRSVA